MVDKNEEKTEGKQSEDAELLAWAEASRAARQKEEAISGTVQGDILRRLEKQGGTDGKTADFKISRFGRNEFSYGDEHALMQTHLGEDGLTRYHTPILDLRQNWWRTIFLEETVRGDISKVGLISPSVSELIAMNYSEEDGDRFNVSNILKTLGMEVEGVEGSSDYAESEIMGTITNDQVAKRIEAIRSFWSELVGPDFTVSFDSGNGDLFRQIRLTPRTAKGQDMLLNHPELDKQHLQKIVDNYDELIERLKRMKG